MRLFGSILAVFVALPAAAQERASHCIAIADAAPGIEYLQKARWRDPLPDDYTVRLHCLNHSMFLLQAPDGTTAVTDYNGHIGGADLIPDIATMNHAHSGHWTTRPDPRIPNLLKGWSGGKVPNLHRVEVGEVLVRNVPTDIRSYDGVEKFGNSIFVFETAGLCVGHLGHLHHEPDEQQYAALGRLDVVMAAVDGSMTLDLQSMIDVRERLQSSVIIPMHWFSAAGLGRFLEQVEGGFDIDLRDASDIEVSLRTLPERPTVVVLRPSILQPE